MHVSTQLLKIILTIWFKWIKWDTRLCNNCNPQDYFKSFHCLKGMSPLESSQDKWWSNSTVGHLQMSSIHWYHMEKDVHPMLHLNRHEGLAWSLQMYHSEAAPVSAFMNFNALSAAGESAIHWINTRAIPVTITGRKIKFPIVYTYRKRGWQIGLNFLFMSAVWHMIFHSCFLCRTCSSLYRLIILVY